MANSKTTKLDNEPGYGVLLHIDYDYGYLTADKVQVFIRNVDKEKFSKTSNCLNRSSQSTMTKKTTTTRFWQYRAKQRFVHHHLN